MHDVFQVMITYDILHISALYNNDGTGKPE